MSRPAPMSHSDPLPPPSAPTRREQEHALLARIREGDAAAFEALYRAYYRPLLTFILPLTQSGAIAEEIIEDVFTEIWKRRESLVIQHGVNTYIFTAVRNRALSAIRRQQVEERFLTVEASEPAQTVAPDTASIDREQIQRLVRDAIESLSPKRRTVLMLRWDQEMSYAEIAEVMGSSVAAVERQLSRTLKALKLALPQWLRDEHA